MGFHNFVRQVINIGKHLKSMNKKSGKWYLFLNKMRFQYRVSVMNENTLEESWFVRLSRFSVFMYGSVLIFGTFIVLASIIIFTPIRYYLPGYAATENKGNIITESMLTDSLLHQVKMQTTYLDMVNAIISGELKPDSIASLDSVGLRERAQVFMEKKNNEEEFVEEFEESEKFNLASLNIKENENVFVFFKPTSGVISSSYDLQDNKFGISILTAPNESVVSVLAGTVIYTGYTFDFGWVIQVQHENEYVSIYKNNTNVLKKAGDVVRAGEAIAFTGQGKEDKHGAHFFFELWRQGKPVDPEELIIF